MKENERVNIEEFIETHSKSIHREEVTWGYAGKNADVESSKENYTVN